MRGRGPWGNHKTLIETLRTRPQYMREHGDPIVCLSANSNNAHSTLCFRITLLLSYTAAFLFDQPDLCRLCCPTAITPAWRDFISFC